MLKISNNYLCFNYEFGIRFKKFLKLEKTDVYDNRNFVHEENLVEKNRLGNVYKPAEQSFD